jgi:hypothetical protein
MLVSTIMVVAVVIIVESVMGEVVSMLPMVDTLAVGLQKNVVSHTITAVTATVGVVSSFDSCYSCAR